LRYAREGARVAIVFDRNDAHVSTAVFLASEDASAIHGATLLVDAGWAAW
jgi:NAD(P)-dependent dehydrogenase (short-subunit alcohol dehydrogenase family)